MWKIGKSNKIFDQSFLKILCLFVKNVSIYFIWRSYRGIVAEQLHKNLNSSPNYVLAHQLWQNNFFSNFGQIWASHGQIATCVVVQV